MRLTILFGILAFAIACEGPVGPVGPMGPQGPPGLPGVSVEVSWDMVMLSGYGDGSLVFRDAQVEGSTITCYTSHSSIGPWYIVATTLFAYAGATSFYGSICVAANSGSNVVVIMNRGFPDGYFLATLIKEGS